jgi:hypothetical protein
MWVHGLRRKRGSLQGQLRRVNFVLCRLALVRLLSHREGRRDRGHDPNLLTRIGWHACNPLHLMLLGRGGVLLRVCASTVKRG